MLEKVWNKLQAGCDSKNRIYAALCLFALAVMVPGAAFAADSALVTAITPGLQDMVKDVAAGAGLVALVVLAVVGAKVIFSLMKKA